MFTVDTVVALFFLKSRIEQNVTCDRVTNPAKHYTMTWKTVEGNDFGRITAARKARFPNGPPSGDVRSHRALCNTDFTWFVTRSHDGLIGQILTRLHSPHSLCRRS